MAVKRSQWSREGGVAVGGRRERRREKRLERKTKGGGGKMREAGRGTNEEEHGQC